MRQRQRASYRGRWELRSYSAKRLARQDAVDMEAASVRSRLERNPRSARMVPLSPAARPTKAARSRFIALNWIGGLPATAFEPNAMLVMARYAWRVRADVRCGYTATGIECPPLCTARRVRPPARPRKGPIGRRPAVRHHASHPASARICVYPFCQRARCDRVIARHQRASACPLLHPR